MPTTAPNTENLTLAEFGQRYRLSRSAIYREIGLGKLTAVKCGRRTLIRTDDAVAWATALPKVTPSVSARRELAPAGAEAA